MERDRFALTDDEIADIGFRVGIGERVTKQFDEGVWPYVERELLEFGRACGKESVARVETMLMRAIDRIKDLYSGDDGQAWDEARKFLDEIEKYEPNTGPCPGHDREKEMGMIEQDSEIEEKFRKWELSKEIYPKWLLDKYGIGDRALQYRAFHEGYRMAIDELLSES